jgi:hypothetical protein
MFIWIQESLAGPGGLWLNAAMILIELACIVAAVASVIIAVRVNRITKLLEEKPGE